MLKISRLQIAAYVSARISGGSSLNEASALEEFPTRLFCDAIDKYQARDFAILFGHSKLPVQGAKFDLEVLQYVNCVSTWRKVRITYRRKTILELDAGRIDKVHLAVAMDRPEVAYKDGILHFKPFDDWWLDLSKNDEHALSMLEQPMAINLKDDHPEEFKAIGDRKLV